MSFLLYKRKKYVNGNIYIYKSEKGTNKKGLKGTIRKMTAVKCLTVQHNSLRRPVTCIQQHTQCDRWQRRTLFKSLCPTRGFSQTGVRVKTNNSYYLFSLFIHRECHFYSLSGFKNRKYLILVRTKSEILKIYSLWNFWYCKQSIKI